MSADSGTMSLEWWLVLIGIGLTMFIAGKPRVPSTLLTLAGALFGAGPPHANWTFGSRVLFRSSGLHRILETRQSGSIEVFLSDENILR